MLLDHLVVKAITRSVLKAHLLALLTGYSGSYKKIIFPLTFPNATGSQLMKRMRCYNQFHHYYGPNKEDVEMFKLHSFEETEKREGMSYSVSDVPWASYPSDILFVMIMCVVCVRNL